MKSCDARRGWLAIGLCIHLILHYLLQCMKHTFVGAYYAHSCLPSTRMSTICSFTQCFCAHNMLVSSDASTATVVFYNMQCLLS